MMLRITHVDSLTGEYEQKPPLENETSYFSFVGI